MTNRLKRILLELYLKSGINLTWLYKSKSEATYPENVFVELTRNCNGHCIMCSRKNPSNDPRLNMPFSFFKRIADELFPYAKNVDLRGFGESTILHNWMDIVDYVTKFDCKFGIVTNLNIRDDSMWDSLIKNDFWVAISFDGSTKKTFEKIRRGSDFSTVLRNIKVLVSSCRKYSKDIGNVYLLVTVQKHNLKEVPDIIRLAGRLGLKKVELSPVQTSDKKLLFNKNDAQRVLQKAFKISKNLGIDLVLIGSLGNLDLEKSMNFNVKGYCARPWKYAYITYDGKIGPCNHKLDPPLVLGNLNKTSFKEVWNNSLFTLF